MLYQQFGRSQKKPAKSRYQHGSSNVKPDLINNMQIKISPFRRTLQKIPYTCNRIEATLPKTYQKETLCLSQSRERRKFKTYSEREHSGTRAIAWAAITIS